MNSCNPVFMTVALRIGATTFYDYLDAFGVSKNTGSGLLGEVSGIIHKADSATDSTVATAGFGQGFTLTPPNMLNVMCCLANDGKLMQPRIVKEITDNDGNIIESYEPVVLKQVVSESTSDMVLDMMESVVSDGTGRYAQVKGYYVAGKTSTAEQGRGANKKYVASFIGFAPADDPEIAVVFNLFNPQGPQGHQGGGICAPVVGKILGEILEYKDVPQDYEYKSNEPQIILPDVTNRTLGEAKKILVNSGLKYVIDESIEDTAKVVSQMPVAGEALTEKSLVKLFIEGNDTRFTVTVPDVRNMNISEATSKLNELGLNIRVSGSGSAILQDPAMNTVVEQGTVVTVEFRNKNIDVE